MSGWSVEGGEVLVDGEISFANEDLGVVTFSSYCAKPLPMCGWRRLYQSHLHLLSAIQTCWVRE